jgi:hypothetical protein
MKSWQRALQDAVFSGSVASLSSAAALALCGKLEGTTAAGPLNGPSQWIWGEQAAYRQRATLRHTAVGYAIHHATSIFWATLHEKILSSENARESAAQRLAKGATTAAVACFVDYQLTPQRLQPGFEKQLSRHSLFFVYAAFAVGLAVTSQIRRSRPTRAQGPATATPGPVL